MTTRKYLRHVVHGAIFDYDERLIGKAELEVVTDRQAYPEKFLDEKVVKRTRKAQSKRGAKPVDISVPEQEEKLHTPPELAAEAGRRWPK